MSNKMSYGMSKMQNAQNCSISKLYDDYDAIIVSGRPMRFKIKIVNV